MRKRQMAWWKALLADLGFAALAATLVFVYALSWIQRRTEISWPVVTGIVAELKNGPGVKGRPNTYLLGNYEDVAGRHPFSVAWAASDWRDRAWVPPDGSPPVGSRVLLHADPSKPSSVALDSGPMAHPNINDVIVFAFILLSLIAAAIAVWFV